MNKPILVFLTALLISGCDGEPKIAGSMSKTTVCATAGYLIKQELGKNFKVHNQKCNVINTGGNNVEIDAGYLSPINPTPFRYTAIGFVRDNTLVLQKIRVHGIDEEFKPFTILGG